MRIDGTGFGCGEKGGPGKAEVFKSFQLSRHQRRIKGYGAPGSFGGMGGSLILLSLTRVHTIHSPKVALCPYTSPPDMCAWAWNICLISDTYHIPKLPLSLCHPPSCNHVILCEIPPAVPPRLVLIQGPLPLNELKRELPVNLILKVSAPACPPQSQIIVSSA